jgi:hypothetical protein
MNYDDFKSKRSALISSADALYSPDNFPGSKAWLAHSAAEHAVKDLGAQYPEYSAQLKAEVAAHKAAKAAAGPISGSLADRIARGVD